MKVGNCVLAPDFCHFGIDDFPFKIPLKKVLQNRRFSALASRSGFGAAKSLQLVELLCVIPWRFGTQCLQIAVEWLSQGSSQLQL